MARSGLERAHSEQEQANAGQELEAGRFEQQRAHSEEEQALEQARAEQERVNSE